MNNKKIEIGKLSLVDEIYTSEAIDEMENGIDSIEAKANSIDSKADSIKDEVAKVNVLASRAEFNSDPNGVKDITGEIYDGYLNLNGGVNSGAGKTTDFIPVNPGDILKLTANGQWQGRCYAFYDADKTKLFVYPDTTESLKNQLDIFNERVVVPEGANFLKVSATNWRNTTVLRAVAVSVLKEQIDNLKTEKADVNLFDHRVDEPYSISVTNGGYISQSTGKVVPVTSEDSYRYTDLIEVENHQILKVSGWAVQQTTLVAFYNEVETFLFSKYHTPISQTSPHEQFIDAVIDIDEELKEHPSIKYMRLSTSKSELSVKQSIRASTQKIVQDCTFDFDLVRQSNVLYNKNWYCIGDSFTVGDFTGSTEDHYDEEYRMEKTYPYWIMKRNKMNLTMNAKCGTSIVASDSDPTRRCISRIFSGLNETSEEAIAIANSDYITLSFAQNEPGNALAGDSSSTDITTIWGAWNVVLTKILTWNPKIKIGIFTYEGGSQLTKDTQREISKYWGIPFIDLQGDTNVPMLTGGKSGYPCSAFAKSQRNQAFYVSDTNRHPNVVAHQYRSTIIENFMRSL